MSRLELDRGSSKLRYAVMGGIAAVFAGGIIAATNGSKTLPAASAETQDAQVQGTASDVVGTPAPRDAMASQPVAAGDELAMAPAPEEAIPSVEPAPAPQAPAAEPVALPEPQTAEPQPVAAAEPEPAAAEVTAVALADTSDSAAPQEVEQPRRAVRPPPPPALGALTPWWKEGVDRDFDVQYVGQVANEQALVIRFSQDVADAQSAARNIQVLDAKGVAAQGEWTQGANPYVLVYRGVTPGRYTVRIEPTLASASGAQLGSALQGPVYVQ